MKKPTYIDLQRRFGGSYVAHVDQGEIIAAPRLDDLLAELRRSAIDLSRVEIEFVDPPDVVAIY